MYILISFSAVFIIFSVKGISGGALAGGVALGVGAGLLGGAALGAMGAVAVQDTYSR